MKGRKKKQDVIDPSSPEFQQKETGGATAPPPQLKSGKLAPSSIFDTTPTSELPEPAGQGIGSQKRVFEPTPSDPQPKARLRWQRKMVIRDIRGRHRLNKTEKILRTERYHLAKSHFMPTSIKKLGPLARQIAGKPLNEAMVQMRFSKKKAAADLLKHLEYARSQAIVVMGMGMGKVGAEKEGVGKVEKQLDEESLIVEDKKGKRRAVTDRSAMYIDEAWVGRGKYQMNGLDYRARGQAHRLMTPFTSEFPWDKFVVANRISDGQL